MLSHAAHMSETTLHIVWAVYPVRMQTVEGDASKSRQGGPSSSFGDKVFATADGDVCDEHRTGMLIEQRTQARQNRLDPLFRHDREDDHLAAGIVEEQIAPIKAMVTYIRHIVNNSEPVALIRSNRSVTNFVCPP